MTQSELNTAARIALGWQFPACPRVALVFDGRMTTHQVLCAVRRIYARHALN
jgi:hypothetical protein